MADRVITLGSSTVQHGTVNDRAYLMELADDDVPWIVDALDRLAEEHRYGKIFAKVPAPLADPFLERDYRDEACIPGFYEGEIDGLFLGKYLDSERESGRCRAERARILETARARRQDPHPPPRPPGYTWRRAEPGEAAELAAFYGQHFASYPFPIHDAAFIRDAMADHTTYYLVRDGNQLAAAASAEQYPVPAHVEMTDFATQPSHRGRGLATFLLHRMEEDMRRAGFATGYTIARALSPGMNITFARRGYRYAGTLTNNTQISGRLESMNVWYKTLADAAA